MPDKNEPIPMPAPGRKGGEREPETMIREREAERDEWIVREGRDSVAPSDRPENRPPHPQDVNDISDE